MDIARPRASLERVLDDFGSTLLELVCGDLHRTDNVSSVVIHDPVDEQSLSNQAVVLGVGVRTPEETARLLKYLGQRGAAALVVRGPIALIPQVEEAVEESGIALLALLRGASWAQAVATLNALITEPAAAEPTAPGLAGDSSTGDLFALANAVAALLDAPVVIEDRSSRVLAFSSRQDEADSSRVETILSRRVPERIIRMLEQRGVFQSLYRSDAPIYVDPLEPTTGQGHQLARVALALRAGDEILGSIWVAVQSPLNPERTQALCDAGKLVALHMLRLRADADTERRRRTDLVSTALGGTQSAPDALRQLGLAEQVTVVLALALLQPHGHDGHGTAHGYLIAERHRLADAFAMHLAAAHLGSACAMAGDVTYGIMPVPRGRADGEERALRVAGDFLDRIGERSNILIGVGSVAAGSTGLPRSRGDADRALRVLRASGASRRAARMADVQAEALLLELGDVVKTRGETPSGPVARLAAYDAEHHASLVKTLQAWLEAFGDVNAASDAMYVHPNTFRYRLRRLGEVGGIDLNNPDHRFAAMLQLRLWPPAEAAAADEPTPENAGAPNR
ncbi:PucR family transcriptional regulator [Streptomyces lydicus]|uniref:PucR family transcriptional regulator n=1 Tax=Streptomyces lydicus TaxID=47763 RepID=UPI0036E59D71